MCETLIGVKQNFELLVFVARLALCFCVVKNTFLLFLKAEVQDMKEHDIVKENKFQ